MGVYEAAGQAVGRPRAFPACLLRDDRLLCRGHGREPAAVPAALSPRPSSALALVISAPAPGGSRLTSWFRSLVAELKKIKVHSKISRLLLTSAKAAGRVRGDSTARGVKVMVDGNAASEGAPGETFDVVVKVNG